MLTVVITHSKFIGFRQDPHNRVLRQVPGNGSQKRRQRRGHGSHHCTYPGNKYKIPPFFMEKSIAEIRVKIHQESARIRSEVPSI